ncbi:TonB-dependent receptor [Acanthopleuribacter pedis]
MNYKAKVALLIWLLAAAGLSAQDAGVISGTVFDKDQGGELPTASVRVDGTDRVVFADVNGFYKIAGLAPGTYSLTAEFAGFTPQTVEQIEVASGTVTVNFELGQNALQEEIKVVYKVEENNAIHVLNERKNSANVSDGISAEEISRSGGSDAADALKKVTGASIVGGKHVFVRGLGDRYVSTQLNGVEMPTADPDVKSFQADLLPANILDNVVTLKTFTPDKPGNFSGGIIDVGTKAYPPNFTYSLSYGSSYQDGSTFSDDYLNYGTSGSDWIGMDDGLRELPSELEGGNVSIPNPIAARSDQALAEHLDRVSNAFEPVMGHTAGKAPLNQNLAFSLGNQLEFSNDRRLGFLGSLTYGRKRTYYDDWTKARWKLTSTPGEAESLVNQSEFDSEQGKDKVNWGALLTGNYVFGNHEIGTTVVYTQGGESTSEYYLGQWPEQFSSENAFLESRLLKYTERNLASFQLRGEHAFPDAGELLVKWTGAVSSTELDEPDTRIFTSNFSRQTINGEERVLHSITPSIYNRPTRYFRGLTEDGTNFNVDVTKPVELWNGRRAKISAGLAYDKKERDFNELRYEYFSSSSIRYEGDPNAFFAPENVGIIGFDEQRGRYIFGNVIQLSDNPRGGDYTGDQEITAYYLMGELPLTEKLRIITGLRYESTDMEVSNGTTVGGLDENDALPSFHVIYKLTPDQNFRFSYGRTLARPNFREKAPYSSFDFIADGIYAGNPDLERTLIDNFDFRWEKFLSGGELLAASAFYKEFENPIERAYNLRFASEFGEVTYLNVGEATVYGIELEARKGITPNDAINRFSVGGNITLIESIVDIPPEELEFLRLRDPDADDTRTLQGQSPYLINLSLNYDNIDTETAASLFYNVFGERLDQVGIGGAPDAKEQPRGLLDFIFSQSLGRGLKLKFSAKNLLDDEIEVVQEFKGQEYIQSSYQTGQSYSLSLSFKPE